MTLAAQALRRTDDLERALQLSQALRDRVEAADWPAAAELEVERRSLLERFFATPPPAAELPDAIRLLRELISANDALVGVAEHLQRGLAREAETVATGRRAVLAYSTHSA